MPLSNLNERERNIIGQCLQAAVEGPFFPEEEFHSLFGLERGEVAAVSGCWPEVDETNPSVLLSVNNAMNNLLGYPHGKDYKAWFKFISVGAEELTTIFRKWKKPTSD